MRGIVSRSVQAMRLTVSADLGLPRCDARRPATSQRAPRRVVNGGDVDG
jgi:hypothetical protein